MGPIQKVIHFLVFIIFFSLKTSCGIMKDLDPHEKGPLYKRQFSTTNNEFLPIIAKFEKAAVKQLDQKDFLVQDIPINFGDTENNKYVGVCFTYSDGKKEIIIDRAWWSKVSITSKETLVFHELGHCRLNRSHDNALITRENKKIKSSIMNESIVSDQKYLSYKNGYQEELFTNKKNTLLKSL